MAEQSIVIQEPNRLAAPYVPNMTTLQSVVAIVEMAYRSGMVKVKNIDDAKFIALYGLELSIPVMTSLRCIYSVNGGAPTCSGELLLALIRRSGKVSVKISSTEDTLKAGRATVYMKRLDSGDEFTATWGKDDDARAQLRSNRDKYPAQMWTWRAVSIAAKALCSDIVGGMYTHEEIYPEAKYSEDGEIIVESALPAQLAPPKAANIIDDTHPASWATAETVRNLISYCMDKLKCTTDDIRRYTEIKDLEDVTAWAKYPDRPAAALVIKSGVDADTEAAKNAPPATPKGNKADATNKPYVLGELKNWALKNVYDNNTFHMNASISKLLEQGKLPPALTMEAAKNIVLNRHASEADPSQEMFDNLPSVKEEAPPVPEGDVPF